METELRSVNCPILAGLIAPASVNGFFSDIWEQRSFHSARADRDTSSSFENLLSLDDVDRIIATGGPRFKEFIRLTRGGYSVELREFSTVRPDGLADFHFDKVLGFFEQGATITINRVHQFVPQLAEMCAALSNEFCAHVNANAYITPSDSQGFQAHSDNHDVFLIQTAGTKSWKIQGSLQFLATSRCPNSVSEATTETDWNEIDLSAGDTLYMPRGLMHQGIAQSSTSCHITVGIHPYTWADLIRSVVTGLEAKEDAFRQSAFGPNVASTKKLRHLAETMYKAILDDGFVKNQIFKDNQKYCNEPLRGKLHSAARGTIVTSESVMRVRNNLNPIIRELQGEVVVLFGTKSVRFPLFVRPHLEIIASSPTISANSLPTNIDMEGRLNILSSLKSEGLLEFA